jgi:hypothetical protein
MVEHRIYVNCLLNNRDLVYILSLEMYKLSLKAYGLSKDETGCLKQCIEIVYSLDYSLC